ncbi:hypothetical protein EUGRSUZ_C02568 [Eucalyptus grandis]|uniref:Uncharacterized protein n=2 Tax=Eucalyptus grandis TaxID=71139 RepID=A0ACC3LG05_EUCGR|nr:hypothetical protein EUGRSUZ_C02568 [Eucalyptus grandis]
MSLKSSNNLLAIIIPALRSSNNLLSIVSHEFLLNVIFLHKLSLLSFLFTSTNSESSLTIWTIESIRTWRIFL